MKPIEFAEQNIVIGKDQPEYMPLPAHVAPDETTAVTTCWELSPEDRIEILRNNRVYLTQLTFGKPLQPIRLATTFNGEFTDHGN